MSYFESYELTQQIYLVQMVLIERTPVDEDQFSVTLRTSVLGLLVLGL